jgi:hypothetical protein
VTFPRTIGLCSSHCTTAALVGACLVVFARVVSAQAFLPAAGEGNVTATYQYAHARGHLDLNGNRMAGEAGTDPTDTHSMMWGVEFGLTDRIAVNVSLPFIGSKYGGSEPHRVGGVGPPQEWDDGTYHGTFQDFQGGVSINLRSRPLAFTPFAEVVIPSHHYPNLAHAAVGKDLRALVVGGAVGGFLDAVLPGIFFQAQLSYAVTQEVLDIRPNRSRVDVEVGYFITPRLAVRFLQSYQVTHNGLDLIQFGQPMTEAVIHGHPEIEVTADYRRNHDRLQRSNYLNLGGGINFAVNESLDVFAAAANTVWGESIHPLRGVSVGANMHFRTRRAARQADRQRPSRTGALSTTK